MWTIGSAENLILPYIDAVYLVRLKLNGIWSSAGLMVFSTCAFSEFANGYSGRKFGCVKVGSGVVSFTVVADGTILYKENETPQFAIFNWYINNNDPESGVQIAYKKIA